MPYKSFETLLEKFPYFLDKKESSNFNKSEKVFNEEFKKVYNNLYNVYLGSKLRKHLLVWKDQEQPYSYDMCFVAEFPYLKNVKIFMVHDEEVTQEVLLDDGSVQTSTSIQEIIEEIYTETFLYEDNINHFEYLHSSTSQTVIPTEKYIISIETWDEYTASKGFPENQTQLNNEFDHDTTLDYWGEFFNIPRRQYQEVLESQYASTYPAYDNQPSEDDYHYMQRILYYTSHLSNTPLPVLEIYKLFSLPATMLNRERLLCRMIDTSRHSVDGKYNREWEPQEWEHKDAWCNGKDENYYLFANVNNTSPIQGQKFKFDFKILNSLAKEVYNTSNYNLIEESVINEEETPFLIVPFINNVMVQGLNLKSDEIWTLTTKDIDEEDSLFVFKAYRNTEEIQQDILENDGLFKEGDGDIVSDEILITVRGCHNADYYVSSDGNDNNDGISKETAFRTLDKAISMIEGEKNIISLLGEEHILNKTAEITQDTTIISCPSYKPIVKCEDITFFKISQDMQLTLQNIILQYKCCMMYANYNVFMNNNNLNYPLNVKANQKFCLIENNLTINILDNMIIQNEYIISGKLNIEDNTISKNSTTYYETNNCTENTHINQKSSNVEGEIVQLYVDNQLTAEQTVTATGEYAFKITPTVAKSYEYQVKHDNSTNFCKSESSTISKIVEKGTITIESETVFEGGINNIIQIPFNLKTNTPKMNNHIVKVEFLDSNNQKINETNVTLVNGEGNGIFNYSSEITISEVFSLKISESTEYFEAINSIEIRILSLLYEIVDDPSLNKGDITLLDNSPQNLSEYSDEDILIVMDNTGENNIYLVDDNSETPENLNDDDIIVITDSEEYNVLINDKTEE